MSSAGCPEQAKMAEKSHSVSVMQDKQCVCSKLWCESSAPMLNPKIRYINNRGVIYLQCDSEDKDSEDNCSIWPVPKNLNVNKTNS